MISGLILGVMVGSYRGKAYEGMQLEAIGFNRWKT